jgi:EpsI family protein
MDKATVRLVVLGASFAFCYAGLFVRLASQWATNSTYSYGFAIPMISGYLVWSGWTRIRSTWSAPHYGSGVLLLMMGMGMLLIGRVTAVISLEALSLLPTLAGLVLLFGGYSLLRALAFPLGYLLLMLPVWHQLFVSVQLPSQELSAAIATRLLRICGVPALHQGTTIALPSVTLDVMAECSGINQLIALTVMTLPAAYLWLKTQRARLWLVAIAVVVGYLSNGLRIAVLGLLTAKGIRVSDPNSAVHLVPGLLTASVAYLTIWGCLSLFSRIGGRTADDLVVRPRPTQAQPLLTGGGWTEAAMIALMLSIGATQLVAAPADVRLRNQLQTVPDMIGGWTKEMDARALPRRFPGFDIELTGGYPTPSGERHFQQLDDELLRTYSTPAGRRIQLYIGYYGRQEDGKELATDVSLALEQRASRVFVPLASDTQTLSEVVQHQGDASRGIVFWYDVNGRIVDSIYLAKAYTAFDTFARHRSNGGVVMLGWDTRDGGTREDALLFAQTILPLLRHHLSE